jgi:hypothetical protein
MSIRESIALQLLTVLQTIDEPAVKFVTREFFNLEQLPITQFPALLIQTANEDRETITIGNFGVGARAGVITYEIRGYVRGTEIDTQRNNLVEAVEEILDANRKLDITGVQDLQVINIDILERLAPLGEFVMRVAIRYVYQRGAT